jgi:hypothetical protein
MMQNVTRMSAPAMTRYFQLPLIHAPLSSTIMLMSIVGGEVCEVGGRMGVGVDVMMIDSGPKAVWRQLSSTISLEAARF